MKTSAWIIAFIALTISACTSQKHATSYVNDDVYNSSTQTSQTPSAPAPATTQGVQVITSPDKAKTQKPASSTLEEDYNDYSYSTRINRFSNKDTTVGYFDNSLSGSSAGVNQGSNDPDVNVYLGYGSGYGGYYAPSFSFGMGYPYGGWDYGWGYPYYGGYYGYGWGYPYYGWYDPWYSPCCYCYGYNDYYQPYYSYDNYYGSRRSLYPSDGGAGTPSARNTMANDNNPSNRSVAPATVAGYTRTTAPTSVTGSPSTRTTQPTVRGVPASQEKYRYARPANQNTTVTPRTTGQRSGQVQSQTTRQQTAPRYARPENVNPAERSGAAQSYSSPVYRQPKSSQEYLAPRSQHVGNTGATNQNSAVRSGSSNTGTRQQATPGSSRTYTSPTRSGSSGYSSPRTNSNTSSPTRSSSSGSYNAPTRSSGSGSYSAPSNSSSSGSYSAPSRSGGSSGGSSGSSGSSGGGGRRK